jgi:hypothetical protein
MGKSTQLGARRSWYHCVSEWETVLLIRENGFISPFDDVEFLKYWPGLWDNVDSMLPEKERQEIYSIRDENKQANVSYDRWMAKYGHGTLVWVSDKPSEQYGPYCFRFTPPKGSRVIPIEHHGEGWVIWAPVSPIPPEYFRYLQDF